MTPAAEELLLRAVRPALERLDMWSPVAESAMIYIAAHESEGFRHRVQVGGGPALGLWQVEPATHDDNFFNFLDARPDLRARVIDLKESLGSNPYDELRDNDLYCCAHARIKLWRRKFIWPADPDDIEAIAAIWDLHYQDSSVDPAKRRDFIADCKRYVG